MKLGIDEKERLLASVVNFGLNETNIKETYFYDVTADFD